MNDHTPCSLPGRDPAGHKGTFGTVLVVGGLAAAPRIMIGGPAFSATAALRTGAGLAVLAVPHPLMAAALTIAPEATGVALPVDAERNIIPSQTAEALDTYVSQCDCLAIGPGFGADEPQQQIVMRLVSQAARPMVIDADGLNALAAMSPSQEDFNAEAVLTPHPGEYRRLANRFGIDADPTQPDTREHAAAALASRLGCVVVLKGANTVISDGVDTAVNDTGNVALATAGSGDVLTGIIASLIAQHYRSAIGSGSRLITAQQQGGMSLLQCARLGVWIHGAAGDAWAHRHGDAGLLASDLLDEIPDVLHALRGACSEES